MDRQLARLDLAAAVEALGRILSDHREVLEDYEMELLADRGSLYGVVAVVNDAHAHLLGVLERGFQ